MKKTPKISKLDLQKAKEKGINLHTFKGRIYKRGWTINEALEIEVREKNKRGCGHTRIYESKQHKIKICAYCKKLIETKNNGE
jgi:hypothetical protein